MADIGAVLRGLATNLGTISGLRVYDHQPGTVTPPAAVVTLAAGTFCSFDTSMSRGSDDLFLVVRLMVAYATEDASMDALSAYCAGSGASSIKAAAQIDPTLGGVANWAVVTAAMNFGIFTVAAVDYLGCDFAVTVGV